MPGGLVVGVQSSERILRRQTIGNGSARSVPPSTCAIAPRNNIPTWIGLGYQSTLVTLTRKVRGFRVAASMPSISKSCPICNPLSSAGMSLPPCTSLRRFIGVSSYGVYLLLIYGNRSNIKATRQLKIYPLQNPKVLQGVWSATCIGRLMAERSTRGYRGRTGIQLFGIRRSNRDVLAVVFLSQALCVCPGFFGALLWRTVVRGHGKSHGLAPHDFFC